MSSHPVVDRTGLGGGGQRHHVSRCTHTLFFTVERPLSNELRAIEGGERIGVPEKVRQGEQR